MAQTKFRSLPLRNAPARVDREQRVIYGVSAAQAVEALGHGIVLDAKTLEQIVELGNAAKNGIKSRFTHPGLSSDGMGKHLGRMKNFRVEGDKAVGDIHLADAASKAPDGDLAGYVMDLAEEDSAALGMSIVAGGYKAWTFDDGSEVEVNDWLESEDSEDEGYRPENATTTKPVFRVQELDAVDVVDEPAANRDGMFSQHLWGTNQLAENMFGEFDGLLKQVGMTPEQAWGYALKYFDARGVGLKGVDMAEKQEEPTTTVEEQVADNEQFAKLQADFNALQERLAAEAEAKAEAVQRAEQLAGALDTTNERIAKMETEARTARFRALSAGWAGEAAAHLTVLEALGEGTDAFNAYVTQQKALSEQIEAGALFSEVGKNPAEPTGALQKLEAEAQRIRGEQPSLTSAQAFDLALQRNPQLYSDYRAEMRGE